MLVAELKGDIRHGSRHRRKILQGGRGMTACKYYGALNCQAPTAYGLCTPKAILSHYGALNHKIKNAGGQSLIGGQGSGQGNERVGKGERMRGSAKLLGCCI